MTDRVHNNDSPWILCTLTPRKIFKADKNVACEEAF